MLSQVRTAEEVLSLTRQMQELWLFGQLKTLEVSDVQTKIDDDARAVAGLLGQLSELHKQSGAAGAVTEQPTST